MSPAQLEPATPLAGESVSIRARLDTRPKGLCEFPSRLSDPRESNLTRTISRAPAHGCIKGLMSPGSPCSLSRDRTPLCPGETNPSRKLKPRSRGRAGLHREADPSSGGSLAGASQRLPQCRRGVERFRAQSGSDVEDSTTMTSTRWSSSSSLDVRLRRRSSCRTGRRARGEGSDARSHCPAARLVAGRLRDADDGGLRRIQRQRPSGLSPDLCYPSWRQLQRCPGPITVTPGWCRAGRRTPRARGGHRTRRR